MAKKQVRAALNDVWFTCRVCDGGTFRQRQVLLNSGGMEFMNLAWANESALGLICWSCGYVHLFAGNGIKLHPVEE